MFDEKIKIIIIYILKDNSKIYCISTKRIAVNYKHKIIIIIIISYNLLLTSRYICHIFYTFRN